VSYITSFFQYTFRELQDFLILWCYHNYKKYPNLFWTIKHAVTISTYIGIYYLIKLGYRLGTFARKYGTERTKEILMLSDRKTLYERYGVNKSEKSWAVITGATDGLGYKIGKILAF
jgi:hypothetical protein